MKFFNSFLLFAVTCISSTAALPANDPQASIHEWVVFVPAGVDSKSVLSSRISLADATDGVTYVRSIEDDNTDSFNAIVVKGSEEAVRKLQGNRSFVVRNQKLQLQGGNTENNDEGSAPLPPPPAAPIAEATTTTTVMETSTTTTSATSATPAASTNTPPYDINDDNWALKDLAQRSTYIYPLSAAANVDVYVLDSGIKLDHPEFEGRAKSGGCFINNQYACGTDIYGHGTAVASIVAGKEVGVAKKANLISVVVAEPDGSMNTTSALAGIQWILDAAKKSGKPSVVVMSFSGLPDDAIDAGIVNLAKNGLYPVVAAGNVASDACTMSPSRTPDAFTVGGYAQGDKRWEFSNYGPCVDIFAPSSNVKAASLDGGYTKKTGTSFAAPYGAGVIALTLGEKRYTTYNSTIEFVKSAGIKNVLTNIGNNSPNLKLTNAIEPKCSETFCRLRSEYSFAFDPFQQQQQMMQLLPSAQQQTVT